MAAFQELYNSFNSYDSDAWDSLEKQHIRMWQEEKEKHKQTTSQIA